MADIGAQLRSYGGALEGAAPVFDLSGLGRSPGAGRAPSSDDRAWRLPVLVAAAVVVVLCVAGVMLVRRSDDVVHVEGPPATGTPTSRTPVSAWRTVPVGPLSPRYSAAAATVGHEVAVFGGTTEPPCPAGAGCVGHPDVLPLRDGAIFDAASSTWRPMADAPVPLNAIPSDFSAVAVLGRAIYVSVHPSKVGTEAAFLRYDLDGNEWEHLPLPATRPSALVATNDMVVGLVGTEENGVVGDSVFDPRTNTWSSLPPDPLRPSFERDMVWTGSELILTGQEAGDLSDGRPRLIRAATFDPATNGWRRLPDSTITGSDTYWVWADGRLVNPTPGAPGNPNFAPGARNGGSFDPGTNTWSPLSNEPTERMPYQTMPSASDGRWAVHNGFVLEVATGRWEALHLPEDAPIEHQATAWVDGELFVWGGVRWNGGTGELSSDGWLWSPGVVGDAEVSLPTATEPGSRSPSGTDVATTVGPITADSSGSTTSAPSTPSGSLVSFVGRRLVSTDVTEDGAPRRLVPGTFLFVQVQAEDVWASSGCNSVQGRYREVDGRLMVPSAATTERGCSQAQNEQDDWLAAFFRSGPIIEIEGSTLTLISGGTRIALVDEADVRHPVVGTSWRLDAFGSSGYTEPLPAGASPSSLLLTGTDGSGTVRASTGCNDMSGTYAANDPGVTFTGMNGSDSVTFTGVVSSQAGCTGANGEQETRVQRVIQDGVSIRSVAGPFLTVCRDGTCLIYRPA